MAEIQNPFDLPARVLTQQEQDRKMNTLHFGKPGATQFYLRVHDGDVDGKINSESVMQMGNYVNP